MSGSVIEGLDTADVFKPLHWHLFAVAQNLCLFVYCKGIWCFHFVFGHVLLVFSIHPSVPVASEIGDFF